ncbi:MAG: glycosyltransferase family 4 protein [Victivallaceae bacterium]|nr:glycosyltransferase family 4 protein [Victivallaceae bacterium]
MQKDVFAIYHFYWPDRSAGARVFSELAEDLARRGWKVRVLTGNRRRYDKAGISAPPSELRNGVDVRRFRSPGFNQDSNVGRLLNGLLLAVQWLPSMLLAPKDSRIIIGTDPQFAYLVIPLTRLLRSDLRIIHWCFDLYPDALYSAGFGIPEFAKRILNWMSGAAIRKCHALIYIGECMKKRLARIKFSGNEIMVVPWAMFDEMTDDAIPDGGRRLKLLYSGTVGHANDIRPFIDLAKTCRNRGLDFSFTIAAAPGRTLEEQTKSITNEDVNVRVTDWTDDETELRRRMMDSDIHLVSLRGSWTGVGVPSKFFEALATGHPVLYCGAKDSEIGIICNEKNVGFVIETADDIEKAAKWLESLSGDPKLLKEMKLRAFRAYKENFSRKSGVDAIERIML